jgi:hypothetical protein
MTAYETMQQGIKAIEAGKKDEGARLLRYALRDGTLRGRVRATALNWLADATSDREEQIRLFNEVLALDPDNDYAQERLAELLTPPKPHHPPLPPDTLPGVAVELPPSLPDEKISALVAPPPPTPVYVPPGTIRPTTTPEIAAPAAPPMKQDYYVVGILDGPNGPGSGFFLTVDGLIVTTRYVVGARESVTVELEPGRQVVGQLLRSFPDIDVALIQVRQPVRDLLPLSPFDDIPANAALMVMPYQRDKLAGRRRDTGRALAPHFFPTDILQVSDAGGAPVFNDRQQVVGLITRNISSSSAYVYGVHIAAVRRCHAIYQHELRSVQNRVYCASCGYASAAATVGGFYCECCGTIMPQARDQTRQHTYSMAALYGENTHPPCPHCGAQIGTYQGTCLRCGRQSDLMRA